MSRDKRDLIDESSKVDMSDTSSAKPTLKVEFQIGADSDPHNQVRMQHSDQELASIDENLPQDSSSSHSIGDSDIKTRMGTSAPVAIPGLSHTAPHFAIQTSPVYSSPQSFMMRQSVSSPTLNTCYFCGSSPKVCQSASTQTTTESAFLEREPPMEFEETDELDDTDDDDTMDDEVIYVPGHGSNRWRSRSESDESRNQGRCDPLPDLLEFRNRSHSEPADVRPEIEVGRELRRISDEFHLSYQECRVTRRRSTSQIEKQSFFWELVGTIRRRASFSRGSSV
ncbi:uncharacterized protein [Ptychodera flava]|uniref:uncharacterized protein n=1 Tax=Ptychodera flava TaxID=63121 RepID=UPI003969C787